MVTSSPERQMPDHHLDSAASSIVAFDFDGTLTTHDSFNAFLRWRAGLVGYGAGLARLGPAAGRWLLDRDLTQLKSAMIRIHLRGLSRRELAEQAARFAAGAAPSLFRPDALAAWRRHQAAGARLVIVTASPDAVVAPFAEILGADRLIGTRLRYDAADRVAGGLDGANCRGAEKVRRLRETLGPDVRIAAAYGDTDGDLEMLAMAEAGFMRLFTARPAPDQAPASAASRRS